MQAPSSWLPPPLAARQPGPELMDTATDITPEELAETLAQLRLINRRLGGYATTRRALDDLLARTGRPAGEWTVLDVGGGSGDAAPEILAWGRSRGVGVRVTVADRDPRTAAEAARRLASTAGASARCEDLFDVPAKSFDVVHAALFLHHFDGADAARALRRMAEIARAGVVVNDLRRHPVPWTLIRWLTGAFSKNRLVRFDAPLSVARAFTADDWRTLGTASGLDLVAHRTWAWRWAVSGVPSTAAREEEKGERTARKDVAVSSRPERFSSFSGIGETATSATTPTPFLLSYFPERRQDDSPRKAGKQEEGRR